MGSIISFGLDEDAPQGRQYSVVTTQSLEAGQEIFLVDHLWTFRTEAEAKAQLGSNPPLVDRLASLFELDGLEEDSSAKDRSVFDFHGSAMMA